eukprot:Nk52_evm80s223 gene=Nk52_evmTU80s223
MALDDEYKGLILALSSSAFIGSSFIIKKKGLIESASTSGNRAGAGSHAYLMSPLWWTGMITMIVGEVANFVAYTYAPAILVTPLGALSVLVSAVMASIMLEEKLHQFGKVGCLLCIVGSVVIILQAPEEGEVEDVLHLWSMMMEPGFLFYAFVCISTCLFLIFVISPKYGHTNILVYLFICAMMGSLTVMACKGLGIAVKLTLSGKNQLYYPVTWFLLVSLIVCIAVQMNYLNKSLDIFNTALVSPIYYVMFTTFTITAAAILYKEWANQSNNSVITELCGFITIVSGVYLLYSTKHHDEETQRNSDLENIPYSQVNDEFSFPRESSISVRRASGRPISGEIMM